MYRIDWIVILLGLWCMLVGFLILEQSMKIQELEKKVEWLEAQNDNVIETLMSE